MITKILKELGISPSATRVYMQLLEYGSSPARRLAENLGVPRPSVYGSLKQLIQKGLVIEREEGSKKVFQTDDPKNLPRLIRSKIEELEQDEKELTHLVPSLIKQVKSSEPHIKFYPGVDGVKQILYDILWHNKAEVLTMWPFKEMVAVLGNDHLANFNRQRIRRNISILSIFPRDKAVALKDYPFIGIGKEHLRELRLAPQKMTWGMWHAIYDDKVSFISSRKESFGFIVNSHDFAELMRTQFEVIWNASKSVKAEPQWSKDFLRSI